jgi:hypothetical protein
VNEWTHHQTHDDDDDIHYVPVYTLVHHLHRFTVPNTVPRFIINSPKDWQSDYKQNSCGNSTISVCRWDSMTAKVPHKTKTCHFDDFWNAGGCLKEYIQLLWYVTTTSFRPHIILNLWVYHLIFLIEIW